MKSLQRSFPPPTDSRRTIVSYLRKYGHLVQFKRLGHLRLSRNSMAELTDRFDMTVAAFR